MQSDLRALFAGKREAVLLPPRRGPGRPKKPREAEAEAPDAVFDALSQRATHEGFDVELLRMTPRRMPSGVMSASKLLVEASGATSVGDLRMPGSHKKRRNEGPQLKLQLCKWIEGIVVKLGGDAEVQALVLAAAGEQWGISKDEAWDVPGVRI